jgi:hypothetical protein
LLPILEKSLRPTSDAIALFIVDGSDGLETYFVFTSGKLGIY